MTEPATETRSELLQVRMTPSEMAQLRDHAARGGLGVSAHARQVLVQAPPPRRRPTPSLETDLLAQTLRELGKLGSNVNQIARRLNMDMAVPPREVIEAMTAVLEVRSAVLQALGIDEERPRR